MKAISDFISEAISSGKNKTMELEQPKPEFHLDDWIEFLEMRGYDVQKTKKMITVNHSTKLDEKEAYVYGYDYGEPRLLFEFKNRRFLLSFKDTKAGYLFDGGGEMSLTTGKNIIMRKDVMFKELKALFSED